MTGRIRMAAALVGAVAAALCLAAAPARAATLGLLGEFWDTGGLGNLAAAEAAIASRPADATFAATAIDYPRGARGAWSDSNTLAAFLAEDAASLVGDGTATLGGSVFRFSGFIALEAGLRSYAVGSDDGFSLRIGGETVAEHRRQRAFGTSSVVRDFGGGWAPIELIYFENRGNTGVEFRIDDRIVAGDRIALAAPAAVPLPATAALLIAALTVAAWISVRRRAVAA